VYVCVCLQRCALMRNPAHVCVCLCVCVCLLRRALMGSPAHIAAPSFLRDPLAAGQRVGAGVILFGFLSRLRC